MSDAKPSDGDATTSHLRGSVLLVAGRVLAIFINFAVQILTVRYLAKSDYGVFAFALAAAAVLSILSSFGMDKAASRYLSVFLQQRDYARFWGMVTLMFATVLGLGTLSVTVFVAAWALELPVLSSDPQTQLVLAIIAGLAACNALDALFLALFAVSAKASTIFVRRYLLGPLLKLAAAFIVMAGSGSVVAFAIGQLAAGLIGILVCIWLLIGIVRRQTELCRAFSQPFAYPARQLYGYSATLLSGDLAFLLRGALVPLVVGIMYADAEVASYQAVLPLARLNEFVLVTFTVLFLPNAAKLSAAGRDGELQSLFEKTTLWVTLLSFPVFAVSFLGSHLLPVWLFGPEYESSGAILAWLALGFFANAAFGTNLRLLRASSKWHTLLLVDFILIGIALTMVIVLVPQYGAIGGAWAVCATYAAQSVLYQVFVATTTKVNPFAYRCVGPFVVGVALCIVGKWLYAELDASWPYSIAMAAVVSLAVLLAFGKKLDVLGTFPELAKLPILRRWIPSGGTNLP